jgi:hypothetical protein
MSTVRQTIITDALALAATITVANGYSTTVAKVSEWRDSPVAEAECPAIDIRDTIDELAEDENWNMHICTLEVRGTVAGASSMTNVRALAGDIIKAFDGFQPSGTSGSRYFSSEFERMTDKNDFGGVLVTIYVYYPANTWRI